MKYLVARIKKDESPCSKIHCADNDRNTLCDLPMDERMYIIENRDIQIEQVNCSQCKLKLRNLK